MLKVKVIAKTDSNNVIPTIKEFVATGSIMVTDEHHAYNKLHLDYTHKKVNHREKGYVRYEDIKVHTNSIEGFWNILKKQINGIHHSVSQNTCNVMAMNQHLDTIVAKLFKMKDLQMLWLTARGL